MSTTSTEDPAHPGRVIAGRYRVLRTLGRGGMGSVVEVLDLVTDRLRALKLMRAEIAHDPALHARFRLEATVAGRVESEHVIEILDAGIDEASGAPYLVMELLRGEDLAALVRRGGPLPRQEALAYLSQVARGLERTHADGIVHRDLKLENLFLSRRDDGSPRITILDFGIAKVIALTCSQSTRSLGTPLYMAPEQLAGDGAIDTRADLYALAHVAFTLLTGFAYFKAEYERAGNLFALATQIARGPLEPATLRARAASIELPGAFDAWFERATATAVDARFDSASAQIEALGEALETQVPRPVPMPSATDGRTPADERASAKAAQEPETIGAGHGEAVGDTSSTGVVVPSIRARPATRSRLILGAAGTAAVALVVGFALRSRSVGGESSAVQSSNATAETALAPQEEEMRVAPSPPKPAENEPAEASPSSSAASPSPSPAPPRAPSGHAAARRAKNPRSAASPANSATAGPEATAPRPAVAAPTHDPLGDF